MANLRASAARENFADTVSRVAYGGERIVLERRGKPVAAVVSLEDLALLERLEDEADYREALRAEREARKRGEQPMTLAEVKRRIGLR